MVVHLTVHHEPLGRPSKSLGCEGCLGVLPAPKTYPWPSLVASRKAPWEPPWGQFGASSLPLVAAARLLALRLAAEPRTVFFYRGKPGMSEATN